MRWWPFKRPSEADPDTLRQEQWKTDFRRPQKSRFVPEVCPEYTAEYDSGGFALTVLKPDCFAWTVDPLYQYADLIAKSSAGFSTPDADAAFGFVLRHKTDRDFYYFLVRSSGQFRFDLVFNGTPTPLIPWTDLDDFDPSEFTLEVFCRTDLFTFFVDGKWVGEAQDESISEGKLGFGMQNFHQENARALVSSMSIEARSARVYESYDSRMEEAGPEAERRLRIARRFYEVGRFQQAVVEYRRASAARPEAGEDAFNLMDSYVQLGLHDRAREVADEYLRVHPRDPRAVLIKAEVLYLQNDLTGCRDFLLERREGASGQLLNLLGNACYALGDWERAEDAYARACDSADSIALYWLHRARAAERAGKPEDALSRYLEAGRRLFREEAYEDLESVVHRVEALDPENWEVRGLKARVLFHQERFTEAKALLEKLYKERRAQDTAVPFLLALILTREGERTKALPLLEDAAVTEEDFALYWFKYAEALDTLGRDPGEALAKARELDPDDPWILNLFGHRLILDGRPVEAVEPLERAYDDNQDPDIAINLAEAYHLTGHPEQAFELLSNREHAGTCTMRGNLFARQGKTDEALIEFEKAASLEPTNRDYLLNAAGAALEADMIFRAEELLGQAMELGADSDTFNLFGNLARIRGEALRAESAYLEALKLDPDNREVRTNLADLYATRSKFDRANEEVDRVLADGPHPRAEKLRQRILEATHNRLECASCGREWWVPKILGIQPALKLRGEPPDDAPAGRSPETGRLYCVGCAKSHVVDGRFTCPDTGVPLKIAEDALKYLLARSVKGLF